MQAKQRARGVTLIELLVVVVIVGILAAVIYPSYQSHTQTARRASAQAALSDAANRQEQFFLDNRSYAAAVGGGGLNLSATTEGGYYALAVDAPSAACPIDRCYVLRATPQGSQAGDSCGPLTMNSAGTKSPANCW